MALDGPRVLMVMSQAVRDAGISYKADGTYSHPSGLRPVIPAELDAGYVIKGLAVREGQCNYGKFLSNQIRDVVT
jgi:hypothetical protein